MSQRQKVALFGASGTMGFQAFKELWKRRGDYDISILVLPSEQELNLFRPYEQQAEVPISDGPGVAEGSGFKIVWGDATHAEDVVETVQGADWVLNAMAYISPMADYHPELAKAVNENAIKNIIQAIEAQPGGAERIHYIHTGTVAETGNRPPGIHVGRVGDPLKPSIYDYYAITKIAGERAVLESNIKRWASLRMTFIMPTTYQELLSLSDAISFHMPMDAYMENLSDRDAGYGLLNCLDIPDESDFWRRVYNMGGGPDMRCTAYEYANHSYGLSGISGVFACTERRWFATRNFHMQYYEDSHILNDYLHYWRDTMESYLATIRQDLPASMKLVSFLSRLLPPFRKQVEGRAYQMMEDMVKNHRNGTAYWYRQRMDDRISAFYGSYEEYEAIPTWSEGLPQIDPNPPHQRLDHGYDEDKESLEHADLQGAAAFRGGVLLSPDWDGDQYAPLEWECAFEHRFTARPATVLMAGHWCPVCVAPPWNFDEQARRSPFIAQVWYADHDPQEDNCYPEDCMADILDADREWEAHLGSD